MKDMLDIVAKFEKILYGTLILMLMAVLVFAVVQIRVDPDHLADQLFSRAAPRATDWRMSWGPSSWC